MIVVGCKWEGKKAIAKEREVPIEGTVEGEWNWKLSRAGISSIPTTIRKQQTNSIS